MPSGGGIRAVTVWKPLGAFADGERLVPEGLLEMIV